MRTKSAASTFDFAVLKCKKDALATLNMLPELLNGNRKERRLAEKLKRLNRIR
jgi:hypothetical protein